MLSKNKYTFIIGAGGSFPYNFPLGTMLFEQIRNKYTKHLDSLINTDAYLPGNISSLYDKAVSFTEALKMTTAVSIDKYLNINPKFKETGIMSIATQIYVAEQYSVLPFRSNQIEGDWYSYLYQKLIQDLNYTEEIFNISKNKISFITFNYDRSLEHFLFENLYGLLRNAEIRRESLAKEFLKIPFIHVYGKIGHLPWENESYVERDIYRPEKQVLSYGSKNYKAASVGLEFNEMIDIMYSERKDNPEIKTAHKLISEADIIFFLGFGYDSQNLNILDIPNLLRNKVVYGTGYGLTKAEIKHIKNIMHFQNVDNASEIYNYDNLRLLREHLI